MIAKKFKTLHEVIAAWNEQADPANREELRERFANFVFWEARGGELDALMSAIASRGYVSVENGPRPKKYTVSYYDAALEYHLDRIESYRPLAEIEAAYYSDFDVHEIVEGWK